MQSIPRVVDNNKNFIYVDGKSVCLICMQHISSVKEYSFRRQYDSNHSDTFSRLRVKAKTDKLKELSN